jgi:drug/metabolite transporter (DMT)-like permease
MLAAIAGVVLLKETVSLRLVVAAAVILSGVGLAVVGPRRSARA